MAEPDPRSNRRRLAAVAGVLIVIVVGALVAIRALRPEPAQPPAPAVPTPAPLALPEPSPLLGRAELLAAAEAAASAYAAGEPAPPDAAALVGRRFELSLPFGCAGPSATPTNEPARWTYDAERKTLRMSASRQEWGETSWAAALAAPAQVEAVEGFWISRPWTRSDACPPAPGMADVLTLPSEHTLGVAAFFAPDSSRGLQRGARPYEFVQKSAEPPADGAREYRLVIRGRIVGFADGQPVRCRALSFDQRPVCLFAVSFDQTAFEDPRTGAKLAEWKG